MKSRILKAALSAIACWATSGVHAGETPPPGPPWKMDFMAARKEAMKEGRPIFMYFTKTV
jgi:hypothetical protein